METTFEFSADGDGSFTSSSPGLIFSWSPNTGFVIGLDSDDADEDESEAWEYDDTMGTEKVEDAMWSVEAESFQGRGESWFGRGEYAVDRGVDAVEDLVEYMIFDCAGELDYTWTMGRIPSWDADTDTFEVSELGPWSTFSVTIE